MAKRKFYYIAGIYGGVEVMKRTVFAILFMILLATEILIGMYATGWVRSYLGDVLVVILLYAFARMMSPEKPARRFILPTVILVFAFLVEFLQLWGFCDRFGITNRLLRIIIGTGFSVIDILSYTIGIVPCCIIDYFVTVRMKKRED